LDEMYCELLFVVFLDDCSTLLLYNLEDSVEKSLA